MDCFLRIDNFVTVSGKVCYVKSFQILSRKMHNTWMLVKINILCAVCINIQCIKIMLNLTTMHEYYPVYNQTNTENNSNDN